MIAPVWLGYIIGCTGTDSRNHQLPAANEIDYPAVTLAVGTFQLGAHSTDKSAFAVEKPRSQVAITPSLAMGRSEVTQALWRQITGLNPSKYKPCGDSCPVESVNFCDVILFSNRLSEAKGLQAAYTLSKSVQFGSERLQCNEWAKENISVNWKANGYRLPTEAEWEYAAKAGSVTLFSGGDDLETIDAAATKIDDSTSHPVGQTLANAWGLHGMSGNVWEWVWDPHQPYTADSKVDPNGGNATGYRSFRGGGWSNANNYTRINCSYCRRITHRGSVDPGFKGGMLGFRLVRRLD